MGAKDVVQGVFADGAGELVGALGAEVDAPVTLRSGKAWRMTCPYMSDCTRRGMAKPTVAVAPSLVKTSYSAAKPRSDLCL